MRWSARATWMIGPTSVVGFIVFVRKTTLRLFVSGHGRDAGRSAPGRNGCTRITHNPSICCRNACTGSTASSLPWCFRSRTRLHETRIWNSGRWWSVDASDPHGRPFVVQSHVDLRTSHVVVVSTIRCSFRFKARPSVAFLRFRARVRRTSNTTVFSASVWENSFRYTHPDSASSCTCSRTRASWIVSGFVLPPFLSVL